MAIPPPPTNPAPTPDETDPGDKSTSLADNESASTEDEAPTFPEDELSVAPELELTEPTPESDLDLAPEPTSNPLEIVEPAT